MEGMHIVNLIYPIGSIYLGTNALNPCLMFGGIWKEWGSGRVPVGVHLSQAEFSQVEQTGGTRTHTLAAKELPRHEHALPWAIGTGMGGSTERLRIQNAENSYPTSGRGRKATIYPGYAEMGRAHNNLQPYITCFMLKRIS